MKSDGVIDKDPFCFLNIPLMPIHDILRFQGIILLGINFQKNRKLCLWKKGKKRMENMRKKENRIGKY